MEEQERQPKFHWAWFTTAGAVVVALMLFLQIQEIEGETRILLEEAGDALARCEQSVEDQLPGASDEAESVEACVLEEPVARTPADRPEPLGIVGEPAIAAHLVEALNSGDAHQRCRAAQALGGFQYASSVLALRWAATRTEAPFLARCAGEVLEWMGERAQAEALLRALPESHYGARRRVIEALAELRHPRVVPVLADLIKDRDPRIRRLVLEALGEMRQDAATSALVEALKDFDYSVRRVAARQLGKIGASRAVTPLGKALQDSDPHVRAAAADALGTIGSRSATPALASALVNDDDAQVRQAAAEALGRLQDSAAIPELIGALSDDVLAVRMAAVRALAQVGRPAVSSLEAELDTENPDTRIFAAQALAQIDAENEALVPVLERALSEEDAVLRFLAAQTLGELHSEAEAAADALGKMVAEDSSAENRMMAAMALGDTEAPGAADALVPALTDPDARVRRMGVEAFQRLGPDPEFAVPILSEMLHDESAEVRRTVVRVLGESKAPSARIEPLLRAMVSDEDPEVRAAAELAVVRLQGANRR